MNEIRERVESDRYEVDSDAVARALLERLMAGSAFVVGRGQPT